MKKPIYIKRTLILSDAFLLWCKQCGFETRLPKEELHVTIAYSREPVDTDTIELQTNAMMDMGSVRQLKMFGDAVVLTFQDKELYERWNQLKALGCSWDYDDYSPHITITYNKPHELDINDLIAFNGQLIFSHEELEDLNLDKSDEYEEVKIKKNPLEW